MEEAVVAQFVALGRDGASGFGLLHKGRADRRVERRVQTDRFPRWGDELVVAGQGVVVGDGDGTLTAFGPLEGGFVDHGIAPLCQGFAELDQALRKVGQDAVDAAFDQARHLRFVVGVERMDAQSEAVGFIAKFSADNAM